MKIISKVKQYFDGNHFQNLSVSAVISICTDERWFKNLSIWNTTILSFFKQLNCLYILFWYFSLSFCDFLLGGREKDKRRKKYHKKDDILWLIFILGLNYDNYANNVGFGVTSDHNTDKFRYVILLEDFSSI